MPEPGACWLGAVFGVRGALWFGTLVALGAYLAFLDGPLSSLANARVEFTTSMVSFERVFELLDMPVDVQEAVNPVKIGEAKGHIEFDDVWFNYESDTPTGLESVRRFGWRDTGQVDDSALRQRTDDWAARGGSARGAPGGVGGRGGRADAGKPRSA